MNFKVLLFGVTGLTLALGLQACGKSSGASGSDGSGGSTLTSSEAAGLAAFQSGLYAFGTTQGCVSCHAAAVAPFWMSSDLNTAYAQAKTVVNFADPTASIFILYSGNNHCGVAACEGASNPSTVTAILTAWAQVENSNTGATTATALPNWVTATIALPSTIPAITSATTPAVVNFQLANLTPPVAALSKAIFQVEVQMANATTYKFSNPRIGGNTSAVTVGGVHVFILPSGTTTGIGTEGPSPADLWDSLTGITAAVFAQANTNPTTPIGATPLTTGDIYVQVGSSADSITVGFDNL